MKTSASQPISVKSLARFALLLVPLSIVSFYGSCGKQQNLGSENRDSGKIDKYWIFSEPDKSSQSCSELAGRPFPGLPNLFIIDNKLKIFECKAEGVCDKDIEVGSQFFASNTQNQYLAPDRLRWSKSDDGCRYESSQVSLTKFDDSLTLTETVKVYSVFGSCNPENFASGQYRPTCTGTVRTKAKLTSVPK